MSDEAIRKRTQETAKKLFGGGIKMDPPYLTWKEFDKDLANDFSMHITGNLYSRTVLTLPERQMVACAMLAALRARDELKLHVNAALNVGCDPKKLTEIFFQLATYAGMPSVNEALAGVPRGSQREGRVADQVSAYIDGHARGPAVRHSRPSTSLRILTAERGSSGFSKDWIPRDLRGNDSDEGVFELLTSASKC